MAHQLTLRLLEVKSNRGPTVLSTVTHTVGDDYGMERILNAAKRLDHKKADSYDDDGCMLVATTQVTPPAGKTVKRGPDLTPNRPPLSHVMVLDCDTATDMLTAMTVLQSDGISATPVESSPGKYWILTDKSSPSLGDLIERAGSITGCDFNFLGKCRRDGAFQLRAFKRVKGYPSFTPACSEAVGRFKDPCAKQWASAFIAYYGSNFPDRLFLRMKLQSAGKDGIPGILADPDSWHAVER